MQAREQFQAGVRPNRRHRGVHDIRRLPQNAGRSRHQAGSDSQSGRKIQSRRRVRHVTERLATQSPARPRVRARFEEFRRAVETARPRIQSDKMQGQTFTGTEAKAAGLVDKVGNLNFARL